MGVGVKEEKENHAKGHEIHVDQKKDSAMVKAPAALHATDGVGGAGDGGECGEDEGAEWRDCGGNQRGRWPRRDW